MGRCWVRPNIGHSGKQFTTNAVIVPLALLLLVLGMMVLLGIQACSWWPQGPISSPDLPPAQPRGGGGQGPQPRP